MTRVQSNKTRQYLSSIVNSYGSTFLKELNNLTNYISGYPVAHSILSFSIADHLWYKAKQLSVSDIKDKPYLFIVFDTKGVYNQTKGIYLDSNKGKVRFGLFLSYIRKNKNYVSDYWFDNNQHCIIFSLDSYSSSYTNFFLSRYSKMYKPEDLKTLKFSKTKYENGKEYYLNPYAVLTKDPVVGEIYLKKAVYEHFGVDIIPENPEEYDVPWTISEEILNSEYMSNEEIILLKQLKGGNYN